MTDLVAVEDDGPSGDDLAAIETEWPLIDAEMALVEAEIQVLTSPHGPDDLAWRRLRLAERRVAVEAVAYAARVTRRREIRRAA